MKGFIDIRPGDGRLVAASALALFTMSAAHAVLETTRDALFVAALPPAALPVAYATIALLSLAALARRASPRGDTRSIAGFLVVAAAITAAMTFLPDWPVFPFALYIWSGVVGTAGLSRVWMAVGNRFAPGQAKRLYSLVAAGGLVGAIAGALAAFLLARVVGPRSLLLAAAAALVAAAAVIVRLPARPDDAERAPSAGAASRAFKEQPYLRRLLAMAFAAAVAGTLVDFLFKSQVAARVATADLPGVFALATAASSALALAVQLAVAPWFVARFGAAGAAVALPVALAGAAVAAMFGGFAPIAVTRGADAALRTPLWRVAAELLLIPLPAALRARAKPALEAIGTRGGQTVASALILGALAAGAGPRVFAAGVAVVALAWIATTFGLRRRYVDLARERLRDGHLRPAAEAMALGATGAFSLVESLSSSDDSEVVMAMDLLARAGRAAAIPSAMLYHPSSRIVLAALRHLAERPGFAAAAAPLHHHPDADVRALALRLRVQAGAADIDHLAAMADPSPLVVASALIALLRRAPEHERALFLARRLARGGPAAAKIALADALADEGGGDFLPILLDLAGDSRPEVQAAFARAARAMPSPALLPRLVELLVDHDLRRPVRQAIVAIGPSALGYLEGALRDPLTLHAVRRHLPRTIAAFRTPRAAAILLGHLAVEQDGVVRFKLLRGLNQMRGEQPDLPIDEAAVHVQVAATVRRALEVLSWRVAAAGARLTGHDAELLLALLADKEEHALERLFRLVGILHPRDDLALLHAGLRSPDRRRRDAAVDLAGESVDPSLRGAVLAMIDDLPDAERLARAGRSPDPWPVALVAMRADHSEPLRAIAARLSAFDPVELAS